MKMNAKLSALVLSLGSSLFLGANANAQNSPNPKVLYVGDSIAVETADTVGWWSHNYSNSTMTRAMFGGLAICDFTQGKSSPDATDSSLTQHVKEDKPDIVVLSFVGNRFTSCMQNLPDNEAYYNKYKSDAYEVARQVTEAAKAVGIKRPKIMWVLQGPWDNGHTTRMNKQYREVAAASGDLVSDAGAEVSMAAYGTGNFAEQREIYTTVVPCSQFERDVGYCTDPVAGLARVHKDSDGVHYCLGTVTNGSCDTNSPGILRYGMRIAGDIHNALMNP